MAEHTPRHKIVQYTEEKGFCEILDKATLEGWSVLTVWQDGGGQFRALLRFDGEPSVVRSFAGLPVAPLENGL